MTPVGPVVDAHVHIWDAGRATYPWLADTGLRDRYGLADVGDEFGAVGVDEIVLVQAADDLADTDHMLDVGRSDPRVAGVVAWAPLREPATVAALLEQWSDQPVVGLRHLIHRDPDRDFLRDDAVNESLAMIGARGLTFDICAESLDLLALVPEVATRQPHTTFVIDHLAKPPIRERGWDPWAELLASAARCDNVVVKLSGLNTAAAPGWTSADFVPFVDHAIEWFGPDRMMCGSDWPFAMQQASSYTQIWAGLDGTLRGLSHNEHERVTARTARRIYRLPEPS